MRRRAPRGVFSMRPEGRAGFRGWADISGRLWEIENRRVSIQVPQAGADLRLTRLASKHFRPGLTPGLRQGPGTMFCLQTLCSPFSQPTMVDIECGNPLELGRNAVEWTVCAVLVCLHCFGKSIELPRCRPRASSPSAPPLSWGGWPNTGTNGSFYSPRYSSSSRCRMEELPSSSVPELINAPFS